MLGSTELMAKTKCDFISVHVLWEEMPEQHSTEHPSQSTQEYEILGLCTLFTDELELLMYVRDRGVQSKHQCLDAVEDLDQKETQLEDMLCVYLKYAQKAMQQQAYVKIQ